MAIAKHFVETIFVDQEFRVYGILKLFQLNFRGLLGSAKTMKITRLENLDIYGSQHDHMKVPVLYCKSTLTFCTPWSNYDSS